MKRITSFFIFFVLFTTCFHSASHAEKLRLVATLSSYASIAQEIGGDRVRVDSIASPHFNPHFIEPRPSDVLKLKKADLFIHSGLDLEAWRDPLLVAAGRSEFRNGGEKQLDLSKGITLLQIPDRSLTRADGDIHLYGNPHYWIDPRNGLIIAGSITDMLIKVDPEGSDLYRKNHTRFADSLTKNIERWHTLLASRKGAEFIGYHNEWVYLMNFAQTTMNVFLEPKPGIPPTPQHLEQIIHQMQTRTITGLIQATFYPIDASRLVSTKTGVPLLLLCQNVGETPDCNSYNEMIEYNIKMLTQS